VKDIRAALMTKMEAYFSGDMKRINHAHRVTEYAEALMKQEGGDSSIVIGASCSTTSEYMKQRESTAARAANIRRGRGRLSPGKF